MMSDPISSFDPKTGFTQGLGLMMVSAVVGTVGSILLAIAAVVNIIELL